MEMFQVGGCVRDELLGVPSKDIDFCVVLNEFDRFAGAPDNPFDLMVEKLKDMGFKIFLESPEFLTVRAQFPTGPVLKNDLGNGIFRLGRKKLTADFVLARKESGYTDGRRPDVVVPGTLEDDLARRDFTVNAIAKDAQGNLIDPHNGREDLDKRILRAVGDPLDRLEEDALRAVRALRFSITKGFFIDQSLRWAMQVQSVLTSLEDNISDERIQQELSKMFRFDSVGSMRLLNQFPGLTNVLFSGNVNLDATLKQRGFNK